MSTPSGRPRKSPKTTATWHESGRLPYIALVDFARTRTGQLLGGALIVVATILIYLPALQGGFVWDDDLFLTDNPRIHAADGLYRFWLTTEPPDYFPLTSTTLWLEWRLWEMNPFGYHLVNVLLHIFSALLVWRVLARLKIPGALLAGLVFAVHPVCVESVAWITERKNVLPMPLYLISILAFLRFEATGRKTAYVGSLLAFAMALLAKTSVVMAPVVLLGCAWWQRGQIVRRDLMRTLPYFALSLALGLTTVWFQYQRAIGDVTIRTDGLLSRLAVAGKAFWFYLYKALVPIRLSFVYPRWETDPANPAAYLPGLLLLALLGLCWHQRRSWGRPLLFGLGCFLVTLFPVLGFFNIYFMKYSLVADHWQYPALPAVIALAVGSGVYGYRKLPTSLHLPAAAAALYAVGFMCLSTWQLGHSYRDVVTLWRATIKTNPTCWICHDNLGVVLGQQGDIQGALSHLKTAVGIKPDNGKALNNLGNALMLSGQTDEAVARYAEAVRVQPDYAVGHYGLGMALLELHRPETAADHLATALRLDPNFADAHLYYALALLYQDRVDEAAGHCSEALRLNPGLDRARQLLDRIRQNQGPSGHPPGAPIR